MIEFDSAVGILRWMVINLTRISAVISFIFLVVFKGFAQAKAGNPQAFSFKFEMNQPLIYRVSVKTKTITLTTIAGKTTQRKSDFELRYNLRWISCGKTNGDLTSIYFEPSGIEEDMESGEPPNQIITRVRDLDVKSTQSGIVTIDTAREVGLAEAKTVKLGVYPVMLSGYFNFAPDGAIKSFDGDLPFIDYWTNTLKEGAGFFAICFPEKTIGIGDSWNKSAIFSSSDGFAVETPMIVTNTFKRKDDLDENRSIAVFEETSVNRRQNVPATFSTKGQRTAMNISRMDQMQKSTIQFDKKRSVIVETKSTRTGVFNVEMLVQGNPMSMQIQSASESQINLVTESTEGKLK